MSVHTLNHTATATSVAPTIVSTTKASKATAQTSQNPVLVKTLSLQDYLTLETRPRFLREMRESLIEIGTFYIKDHGVPTELTRGAMKSIQDFFAMPLEEKKKIVIGNSRHFRGYKVMGEELTNNQVDHREQLQFAPEQAAIDSFVPSVSPNYQGLQGPNQWAPSTLALLPDFKPHILAYMHHLEILSQHLMEAVALSLNLKASYFRDLFGADPYYRLKCAKYPSVEQAATIGCGAHKDTGFLTVLLQDMVGGLQGQNPATGEWMDTRPIPDTFIVTMGQSIERLTGGLYHATVHRVLNNTSGQDRYSIPFFFDPQLDATIPHRLVLPRVDDSPLSSSSMQVSLSGGSVSGEESGSDDELDSLVDELKIQPDERVARLNGLGGEGWSNGDHIFETVHRCHPEVFSQWYCPA
ncbi:hypothetical protein BGZ70_001630 [Mortierella alpina]|uniref:Fe2OG dioxygenase domain-containing protein n=1 Tax=Mortierella alpina TaxID=64518 RepID=A0A9P6LXX5_MORAP|nr:hypothetical protein BGZ70_001630 [Mortierella alpina]